MNFTTQETISLPGGKQGTLGKIISSEKIEEILVEERKQKIQKKLEELQEQNDDNK